MRGVAFQDLGDQLLVNGIELEGYGKVILWTVTVLESLSAMRVELRSAQWKNEVLTTWRASLATRGVVLRNRHCRRRDGCEACVTHLESRGKTLEAILEAPNTFTGSLGKKLSILHYGLPAGANLISAGLAP